MGGLGMAPNLMPMEFTQQDFASDERVNAFARLRFDDGSYYMHTYQIYLGRNMDLARRDIKRLQKVAELKKSGDIAKAHALLHGKKRKRGGRSAPASLVRRAALSAPA